jgi:hypothetical protein
MALNAALMPRGNNRTTNGAVTAVASTINTAANSSAAQQGANDTNYLLTNIGANVVFIEFSQAAPAAVAAATVANSIPLLPNSQEIMSGPPNAQLSVIAGAAGNTVYVTPGEGN